MQVEISFRTLLRNLLEGQLKLMEKDQNPRARLLRTAIEGLIALEYGETQPIFKPDDRKGSHDGTLPYTIRKLKMQALGFADLLMANKYKPAVRTVAGAYGTKADAFRGWRKDKRLGKTSDPLMKSFREAIKKLDWNESQILDELYKAGKHYLAQKKIAHKSKK
jgi:hypothetical protein